MRFKVGDRVAAYDGEAHICRVTGVVEEIDSKDGLIKIRISKGPVGYVWRHPKQCRRLRQKAPLKRIWISNAWAIKFEPVHGWREFVEVRSKKEKTNE